MKKHLLMLGLVSAIAVPASAEGVYIFGDLGQAKLSVDDSDWGGSRTDTGFSFGVGYALNKNFSFEVGYSDFGKITVFEDEYERDLLNSSAVQASVLAKLPLSDTVDIYGRLGFAEISWDIENKDFEYPEYNDSFSLSDNKTFFGVGASYALNERLSLRAEYNRYAEWKGVTTSTLTVGALYSF